MTTKKQNPQYDCADIEQLVQTFIDGNLTGDELKAFEDHIEYCLPCEKKVEFDKHLKEVVRLKSSESLKPDQVEHYLKKIITATRS